MTDQMIKQAISEGQKNLRKQNNYSVNYIADVLNFTVGKFESYLYARNMLSTDTIIEICNHFQISINQFLQELIIWTTEQDSICKINSAFKAQSELKSGQLYRIIEPMVVGMSEGFPVLDGLGFGQKVRILREDRRLSLTTMAQACDISKDSLKVFESNQKFPGLETFLKFCCALNVSPEYLLIQYLTYPCPVDKRFYLLTPRQLQVFAETSEHLCAYMI